MNHRIDDKPQALNGLLPEDALSALAAILAKTRIQAHVASQEPMAPAQTVATKGQDGIDSASANATDEHAEDLATSKTALVTLGWLLRQVHLSRSQIYALIARGEFPRPLKFGRSARWHLGEFEAWIAERMRTRDAETAPFSAGAGGER